METLLPSQESALALVQARFSEGMRRPTLLLTGPSGSGKSTVARTLAEKWPGHYWNLALGGLPEYFATRNPLYVKVADLVSFLLQRVEAVAEPLVVLDGLESAVTGLLPTRRKEILGLLTALSQQLTGKLLLVVFVSEPGSILLTPGDLPGAWDPHKLVSLSFTDRDAVALGAAHGLTVGMVSGVHHSYQLHPLVTVPKGELPG